MIKFSLGDHNVEVFIPFEGEQPLLASFPKSKSQMFYAADAAAIPGLPNPTTNSSNTSGFTTGDEINQNSATNLVSPTDFVGASVIKLPYNIAEQFATFSLISPSTLPFSPVDKFGALPSGSLATEDLYLPADTNPKLAYIFDGLQALRVPANRFDTTLTDPIDIANNNGSPFVPKLGTYYVKITPNYITVPIKTIQPKLDNTPTDLANLINSGTEFTEFAQINGTPHGQRNIYGADKSFFQGTPWQFETSPGQRGRLYGSIVEVWNSNETVIKSMKTMAENTFSFGTSQDAAFALEYDAFGYDAPQQVAAIGDVLHIYPRETYFKPIFIQIDYVGTTGSVEALIQFMTNDVARNLKTAAYEIYDDKGITYDTNGNITGKVTQAYQITRVGDFEIRKRLKI